MELGWDSTKKEDCLYCVKLNSLFFTNQTSQDIYRRKTLHTHTHSNQKYTTCSELAICHDELHVAKNLSKSVWMGHPNKFYAKKIPMVLSPSNLKFVIVPLFQHFSTSSYLIFRHTASCWSRYTGCLLSFCLKESRRLRFISCSTCPCWLPPRHLPLTGTLENSSELREIDPSRAEEANHHQWSISTAD